MEREISIILKVKGAEAAKKAIESVFNNAAIGQVTKFTVQTQKAGTATQNLGRKAKQTSTQVDSFSKSLGRGIAKLYLYNRAWATFGTQFSEGLELQRASDQFSLNVGNVSKMLPELRTATKGVVSDFDLLKTASKAFQLGLKPERMAQTFKMGTIAAQKLGLEASDAINTITNAITKQDEGALNTLGIVTKVNQAYKTQAALIAKSGGVMSNVMSIQLRQSLIMSELQKRFGGVNKVQDDGLAVLERFKASWKNFRAEIGQTLGTALIPLTRVLTGFLDTITRILDRLNDTSGFQRFVQLSATLAGIWAGAKFITGAKTLMTLLGLVGGKGSLKAPKTLIVMNKYISILGATVLRVFPYVKNFLASLAFVAPRLASALSFIPGWGTAIVALTLLFDPLISGLSKVWTAGKVFFQLLNNFDENSGLSKVLKKDADELGSFYYVIETVSKGALFLVSAFKGFAQGISEPVSQVISLLGKAYDYVAQLTDGFWGFAKTGPASSAWLRNTTELFKMLGKAIGFAASAALTFVNPIAGVAGMAMFGGSIAADVMKLGEMKDVLSKSTGNSQPSSVQPAPQAQTSTQVSTPSPRAMNMDYSDDWTEILRKNNKLLEQQNHMMETDAQKQDIRESQRSAQDKVWTRR